MYCEDSVRHSDPSLWPCGEGPPDLSLPIGGSVLWVRSPNNTKLGMYISFLSSLSRRGAPLDVLVKCEHRPRERSYKSRNL